MRCDDTATKDFSRQPYSDDHPAGACSTPTLAALLDAFELDETVEPLPGYGDFWLERDI